MYKALYKMLYKSKVIRFETNLMFYYGLSTTKTNNVVDDNNNNNNDS